MWAEANEFGAGIGTGKDKGEHSAAPNVTISGGIVTANGKYGCSGIGGGGAGNGSFNSTGNAIITTNNGIADTSKQSSWKGIIDGVV